MRRIFYDLEVEKKISKQDLNPQSLRGKKKMDDFDHLKLRTFFLIKDSKDDAKNKQTAAQYSQCPNGLRTNIGRVKETCQLT